MRAVLPVAETSDRGLPVPRVGEVPDPHPGPGEILVVVRATALNRADLLQIRGLYPPPAGESEVPGLECSGVVGELGPGVEAFEVGERVMALLAGGGQAEQVVVPVGQAMRVPDALSFEEAAAVPEAALTAWTNLVAEGGLGTVAGAGVLITAAASGIGTFAVQLARELGARVLVAGRDVERLERLRPLGAEACFELGPELARQVRAATGERGVDLVLDMVGGTALGGHLRALADGGRLVLVGLLGGARAELELFELMRRRLHVVGSVLRARSRPEKARLVGDFIAFGAERLADGRLRPIIDAVYPFEQIGDAYARLEAGGVWGKVVVRVEAS